jgi:pimeloyl-ACP methyl ester carboxylesterase
MLLDQIDAPHAQAQGHRLAAKIVERRQLEPTRRMVVVAHSAGSAVALAAGDVLPPDTLDRVILLAPSVSTGYDVRPMLRASREGMDVFCSKKDWVALGFVTRVVGTADRRWAPAAGRFGFRLKGPAAACGCEADDLRQHFWSPEVAWTGHTGGHNGMHSPAFVRSYLFPLVEGRP